MGFTYGKDVLHSITGLRRVDVADICKQLARKKSTPTATLDVDCSNVCYKVSGRNAQYVSDFLVKWAKHGLHMNPVCDGRVRPVSKQATNQRVADREKHRINAHSLRLEIQSLNRKLKFDGLTDSERNDIREDVAKKQTTMKSKETRSQNVIQSNFEEKLVEELETTGAHARNDAGGAVLPVMTAEFQADAVIMGRLNSGDALMALTDDADIPIISGDGSVAVKGYMNDGSIQLVSTSRATLETMLELLSEAQKDLPEDQQANPTFTPAAFPLFEGVSDRKLRAIIALFLGCDVYAKGMAGVGAKTMSEIINEKFPKFKEECPHASLFAYLKKYLYTYTEGFDGDIVHTYIRALVYEPTNLAPEDGEDPSRTYLDDTPPTKLPLYLEEFALNGYTDIVDGPEVGECKGVGMCTHKFLCADGFDKCVSCDGVVCGHCRASIDERIHCLPCYAAELLVPEVDDEVGATPVSQMRDELASKWGVERAKELTVDEVLDMYAKKEIASARLNGMLGDVPFPVYQSNELDAEVTEHWDTIVEDVNFGEGGAFLSDPNLDAKYLPGILELFSSLVRFESTASTKWTNWDKDPVLYQSLPSLFVDFAAQSRLDDGYRLLKRCIRHSFDSRCKSMDTGVGSLVFDEDGDVGVRLGFDVPASMRKNIYSTEIVATANKLLSCKCTCQCGSQDDERIVCVHTLVVLYLLSMLIMEDLAESMLIDLASRITASTDPNDGGSVANTDANAEDLQWMWSMSSWADGEVAGMKESIVTLMEAAGEVVPEEDARGKTIPDLLQAFVVGTERRKAWKEKSKVPPKPSELGPVAGIKFMGTSQRAKLTMRPSRQEADDAPPQPTDSSPGSTADADRCQLCGWIVSAPLWTGAVSDTMYNERAGYLQEQMEFQLVDLVNGNVVPWTNVYDKGYRAKMVAFRMGGQLVLQPVWADSDRRFGRDETLLTAAVAHDRGANERAVNVCKRSWFVSRGFRPNASAKQMNDAWMTWSFQSNFMFRPVL